MYDDKPIIVIGAGDHARVLLDILIEQKAKIIGLSDKNIQKGTMIYGIPILGDDNEVLQYSPKDVTLVNGIGSSGSLGLRTKVFDFFKQKGFTFTPVVHCSAIVSVRAKIGEGSQVLAGVVINTEAEIGINTIINTNATIEHGCIIGNNVHIAPGCTLSGCVRVGEGTHIGTGSSIIQGIEIGKNVLIGAGSVVVSNINDNCKAYGVPARNR